MTHRRAGRRQVRSGVAALAFVLAVPACSIGDDSTGSSPTVPALSTTPAITTPAITAPAITAPATTAAPPTTEALPVLAERFTSIEVSARIASSGADRVVSIAATTAALAAVPDPGDPLEAAAWCSGAEAGSSDPFVVRITEEAVGAVDGGIEGFELVSIGPVTVGPSDVDTPSAPVPSTLRVELDDGDIVVSDAVLTLAGEPTTGTFRAEAADGTLIEGAFRCT